MYRIKPFSFLGWWLAAAIFVWPLSVVALGAVFFPLGMVYSLFSPPCCGDRSLYTFVAEIAMLPIMGMVIALTMGGIQRWLLRTKLYWAADGWRVWSILGGLIAGFVIFFISRSNNSYFNGNYYSGYTPNMFVFAMPIFLFVVSACQTMALRHAVRHSWLWVLGNLVTGIAFSGLLTNNQPDNYSTYSGVSQLGIIGLAVAALGGITGFVMLYLFERHLLPMKPEGMEEVPEVTGPKSVWDDAI